MNLEEGTSLCEKKFKVVFLGDMFVGKTSIIERFIKGIFDNSKTQHTVGIDFLAKNVSLNKTTYRLHLWDTAGQEKFRSLIPTYLRDANCGIFVYDVTNSQSLKNIHEWMNLFEEYAGDDAAMVLVGNKKDLNAEKEENLQQGYSKKKGIKTLGVSAKTGQGIEKLFNVAIQEILAKRVWKNRNTNESTEAGSSVSSSRSRKFTKIRKVMLFKDDEKSHNCCKI